MERSYFETSSTPVETLIMLYKVNTRYATPNFQEVW